MRVAKSAKCSGDVGHRVQGWMCRVSEGPRRWAEFDVD